MYLKRGSSDQASDALSTHDLPFVSQAGDARVRIRLRDQGPSGATEVVREELGRLTNEDLAAPAQAGFAGEREEHGIENVFVVEFEAGDAGNLAVRIAVLQGQVSNFGLNETSR